MFARPDAEGVIQDLATVEDPFGIHRLHESGSAQLVVSEVALPLQQILDGGVEPTRPGYGEVSLVALVVFPLEALISILPGLVAEGPPLDDVHRIVVEVCVGHAEWLEHFLGGVLAQGFPAGPFDDHGEREVSPVGVLIPFPGLEIEFLESEQLEGLFAGEAIPSRVSVLLHHTPYPWQPARVVDQVPYGDGRVPDGHLGQIGPNVGVEIDLAFIGQQGDGGGGELFRDGAHVKDRGGCDGDVPIQVRVPVSILVDELAVLGDPQGASDRSRHVVVGEDRVDLTGGRGLDRP